MSHAYEHLFRGLLFPLYESGLRRRGTLRYLAEYEQNQWMSPEQLEALQWRKLTRLLAHCWDEVPYYRRTWRALGITAPGDITGPADYARLPVLTKQLIRENFEDLKARSLRDRLLYKSTGGSTGEPLRFAYTRESYERRMATMFRGYGWAGARLGQRTLYLWGAPLAPGKVAAAKDRLYHAAFHRQVLNAFLMSDARMAGYVDAIERFRPSAIVSYVAPIVALAKWMLHNGRRLRHPQRILCAAEALHAPQREIIEQAFGCPAFNTYGCREVMLVAAECEHRNGLHLNADHLRIELQANPGQGGATAAGDLLITDLHNDGMPLLRYANGDLGTPASGSCACGRGLPRLASVDGRRLDALRTADGHFVPGEYIVYIFLTAPGIKRYQVVQRTIDALDITLVRDVDFDERTLDAVREGLARAVGGSIACNFIYAEDIALTATGKSRVTISELA